MRGIELVEDEAYIPFIGESWFQKWLKFFFPKPVVSEFDAQRNFEPYKVQYSDHVSIAKPANINAEQHQKLVHFISSNFDRWLKKDRIMTSNKSGTQTTQAALLDAERELDDPKEPNAKVPYKAIIGELEAERAVRAQGTQNYVSPKDGEKLRDLPAFFEDVYKRLLKAGSGTLDAPSIYDSRVGSLVLLCDESDVLWTDGRKEIYWKEFNTFAAAMRQERDRRQPTSQTA